MAQAQHREATAHNPRVGVGVLILNEESQVLLTLRKLPPEAGCWSIVGGKLDYLETLQECAVREALEEVGVTVAIESLLCVTDHLLPQETTALGLARVSGACPERPGDQLRASENAAGSMV